MEKRVKNLGNRIFLPNGRWLEKGEEIVLYYTEANLLLATNPKLVEVEEPKETKKKRK